MKTVWEVRQFGDEAMVFKRTLVRETDQFYVLTPALHPSDIEFAKREQKLHHPPLFDTEVEARQFALVCLDGRMTDHLLALNKLLGYKRQAEDALGAAMVKEGKVA